LIGWVLAAITTASPLDASVSRPSAGCGGDALLNVGYPVSQRIRLRSGLIRSYVLTLPLEYDTHHPYPLVFGFHGFAGSGADFFPVDGSTERAQRGEFIAVHPDAANDVPSGATPFRAWNAVGSSTASGANDASCLPETVSTPWLRNIPFVCYKSCGLNCSSCSWASCVDDVSFIDELLDNLEGRFCIDRARVRAHGFSLGGMMVFQLLQSRVGKRFEAMVSVGGTPVKGVATTPPAAVRFLGLWSATDFIVPPSAVAGPGRWSDSVLSYEGLYFDSANTAMHRVAHSFGCQEAVMPAIGGKQELTCIVFPGCPAGEAAACLYNGGHTWPEGAHDLIYNFYINGVVWPGTAVKRGKEGLRTTAGLVSDAKGRRNLTVTKEHGHNRAAPAALNITKRRLAVKKNRGRDGASPAALNTTTRIELQYPKGAVGKRSLRAASRLLSG